MIQKGGENSGFGGPPLNKKNFDDRDPMILLRFWIPWMTSVPKLKEFLKKLEPLKSYGQGVGVRGALNPSNNPHTHGWGYQVGTVFYAVSL